MINLIAPRNSLRKFDPIHHKMTYRRESLTKKNFNPEIMPEILEQLNWGIDELKNGMTEIKIVFESDELKNITNIRKNIDHEFGLLAFYVGRFKGDEKKLLADQQVDLIYDLLMDLMDRLKMGHIEPMYGMVNDLANQLDALHAVLKNADDSMIPKNQTVVLTNESFVH